MTSEEMCEEIKKLKFELERHEREKFVENLRQISLERTRAINERNKK